MMSFFGINVLTDIIVKFLLASNVCHYDYFCDTMHPDNHLHVITCFIPPLDYLLHDLVYKFTWDATENTTILKGILYLVLTKNIQLT